MPEPTPNSPPDQPPSDGWELLCAGVLRTRFGRRPTRAVDQAVLRLAAEEAAVKASVKTPAEGWRERVRNWFSTPFPRLAFGAALTLLVVGLGVWLMAPDWLMGLQTARRRAIVCTVSDALGVRWGGQSSRLKVGDPLLRTSFRLEAGAVELTFASTARVAIEGPAQFKLIDGNLMELQAGTISAEVPPRARGFSVKTPGATVVDLGTRFGASVDSNRLTEVDVFQGRVEVTAGTNAGGAGPRWRLSPGMAVTANANGTAAATPRPEMAFPQPGQSIIARPQNCGFDGSGNTVQGEIPVVFGCWSGPAFSLGGRAQGIRPFSGSGMLQFHEPVAGGTGDSQVWQLVDMHRFKALLAGGLVEAKLSAYFNRVPGAANAGNKFGLTLAAFHGVAADAPTLWAARAATALALADNQLTADANPATWEKIEVSAKLPSETDFVIVGLRAIAPKASAGKPPLFPGHFADLVDLKLCTPLRPGAASATR